jgi:hypothetical protein
MGKGMDTFNLEKSEGKILSPPNNRVVTLSFHVKWVPCHHGMARPQTADRDGLQIWRVAANILNKQLWTADRKQSSSLQVGQGG